MRFDKPVVLLALGQILTWAGLYYVFPALLLRWEEDLGWSKADLTAAISLAIFISAFSAPVAGRLIDRGHGPFLMAGSALVGGLAMLGLSEVTELWQFYMIWSVIGMTLAGCLYEPCFALVTRARGADAKQAIILITLIAGFAGSISFPLAHAVSEQFGWRVTSQVFALVVICVAVPLTWFGARLLEPPDRKHQVVEKTGNQSGSSFLANPVLWLLGVGFALAGVAHGVTLYHLLSILNERGIDRDVAVVAASFIGPMQVAGRLAMMAAEKHVSNHGIAVTCFILFATSIVILMGASSTPALLPAFVILFGGAYGIVSIIRPVIARDILGQQNFGAKSGALALLYLCGSASAPFLGSLVWAIGGYNLVLPLLIALLAAGLALYFLANRRSQ